MEIRATFGASLGALCIGLLAIYYTLVEYTEKEASDAFVGQFYMWFIHVMIMIFCGFG